MEDLKPEMSEKFDIILTELISIRQKIGKVKKDSRNTYFKNDFSSLSAYIDATEKILADKGIIFFQSGNGSYDKPIMISTLMHIKSGQWIKSYFPILTAHPDCQSFGSAVTYIRRYSLATLIGLISKDDDGESGVGRGVHERLKKEAIKGVSEGNGNSEKADTGKLFSLFDKKDHCMVSRYIEEAASHFKLSRETCIDKLLQNGEIVSNFERWKNKKLKEEK